MITAPMMAIDKDSISDQDILFRLIDEDVGAFNILVDRLQVKWLHSKDS